MKDKATRLVLTLLAVVFTVSLTLAAMTLPRALDRSIGKAIGSVDICLGEGICERFFVLARRVRCAMLPIARRILRNQVGKGPKSRDPR